MIESIFAWLTALPPWALYASLAAVAAIENIFPPFPADTIVAFGAFLAAHGEASLAGTVAATWVGNVGGALIMYALGRRLCGPELRRRLEGLGGGGSVERFGGLYERYGIAALFLSRFLPAVRAVVPPLAGALHIPALRFTVIVAAASAIWYGGVAVVAYRVGSNWTELRAALGSMGRWTGGAALAIVLVAVAVIVWRRRASRAVHG